MKLSDAALSIGDDLLLIGNNDGADYTMKWGKVANLLRLLPYEIDRGTYIQTSFDRTGGSSGSPVLNDKLE